MLISNPTARLGEEIASEFISKKGYRIIDRNFRKGYGEIDLIAIKDKTLVFFEVKTRTTPLFGGAVWSLSNSKIKKVTQTAQFYKLIHPELPETLRIDAILIDLSSQSKGKIEHIENINGF